MILQWYDMWQHQLCQSNISFFIRSVIFDIFASPGKLPTSWKGSYDFFFGIRRCSEFPDLVDDNILGFEYPLHFCNTSCISTAPQYSISPQTLIRQYSWIWIRICFLASENSYQALNVNFLELWILYFSVEMFVLASNRGGSCQSLLTQ